MFKFWSFLCYFLSIKRRLFITFHLQTDGKTEWQNSTIEAYLEAFVYYKQNNGTRLLPIVEFAYNNVKYISKGYTSFKLNCSYHLHVFYKEDIDPYSRSKIADELTKELRNLMAVYMENLQHTQKQRKRAYNRGTNPKSYALGEKIWLNSKYTLGSK